MCGVGLNEKVVEPNGNGERSYSVSIGAGGLDIRQPLSLTKDFCRVVEYLVTLKYVEKETFQQCSVNRQIFFST